MEEQPLLADNPYGEDRGDMDTRQLLSKETLERLLWWESLSREEKDKELALNRYASDPDFNDKDYIEKLWNKGKTLQRISSHMYSMGYSSKISYIRKVLEDKGYVVGGSGIARKCD